MWRAQRRCTRSNGVHSKPSISGRLRPVLKILATFLAGFAQRGLQRQFTRLGRALGNVPMPGAGDMAQQQLTGRVEHQDAAGQGLHRSGVGVNLAGAGGPISRQAAAVASALSAMQPQITGW